MTVAPSQEIATALGITDRAARKLLRKSANCGKPWRGHHLPVVRLPGQRGGNSGVAWGLDLSRAGEGLLRAYPALRELAAGDAGDIETADTRNWRAEVQQDRYRIIRPVLETAPRSRERGEAYRVATERPHLVRGRLQMVARKTLELWVKKYAAEGIAGLMPKQTGGAGLRRVLISERWNQGIDLADDAKTAVAGKMDTYVKSLLAKSMSARQIRYYGPKRLVELSREAGSELPDRKLKSVCTFTQKYTDQFAEWNRLARFDLDHKAHFDKDKPRVHRGRASRPMEVVWGDVHPVDIHVPDGTGGTLRVRLIGWLDDLTRHLWATVAVLGKGNGIQQEDIATSLWQMVSDPAAGLAEILYLDNGGEYESLAAAMMEIPGAIPLLTKRGVVKAKPYNGPGKGAVERVFATLEQGHFRHIQGWIGGDRTNKKTHAVGKPVKGFQDPLEDLVKAVHAAVAAYNDKPHTTLGGLSPREALRQSLDGGWQSVTVDEDAFDFAFSRRVPSRQIKQSSFRFENRHWTSDAVCALGAKTTVELRVPLRREAAGIFVLCDGKRLGGRAVPDTVYDPLDRDGAREGARRNGIQNAALAGLRAQTDPRVDPHQEQKRFTDTTPLAAVPGTIIRLSDLEGDVIEADDGADGIELLEEYRRLGVVKTGPTVATAGPESAT